MRMDEPYRPHQQGHTAETEDIMAGIRGAFTPTNPLPTHGYAPPTQQGFIPPVGFGGGRGRQGMSQTPMRDGSGEDDEASGDSDEDDAAGARGKEEEERKRPKMTRGSR